MKENDTVIILVGTNSGILSFPLLSISNASNYTCMVTVESNYLEEAIHISTNPFELNLQGIIIHYGYIYEYLQYNMLSKIPTAPPPVSITVLRTNSDTSFFVGFPFNLTCVVNLPTSIYYIIPVNVDIIWGMPDELMLIENVSQTMEALTRYSSTASFVSSVRHDSAEFHCTATVIPSSGVVTRSESKSGSQNFTIGEMYCNIQIIILIIWL